MSKPAEKFSLHKLLNLRCSSVYGLLEHEALLGVYVHIFKVAVQSAHML